MLQNSLPAPIRHLTSKGQQTRTRIVAAAAKLMADSGVAGTTLEHVRDDARVSSSQIYHYFSDKDALVRAVIQHQNDVIVGTHEAMFADLDSLAGLRLWRDFVVKVQRRVQCRRGCPIGSLGSELAEINPPARDDVSAAFVRWAAAIRRGYQAMFESGELSSQANPEKLASATLAALQGGLLLSQLQRDTKPLEAALDTMLDHVASLTVRANS